MSPKKLFLGAAVLMTAILVFQVFALLKYDHFAAEGGLKVVLAVDRTTVLDKYARTSPDFDFVMRGAIQTHNASGGDFLTAFAESNKSRLKKTLVELFSYKEIDGLELNSSEEEVLEFLRSELKKEMDESAEFVVKKVESASKFTPQMNIDYERLLIKAGIPGANDANWFKQLIDARVELGFYELMPVSDFTQHWNTACELTKLEPLVEDEWLLTGGDEPVIDTRQSLLNCVIWQDKGFAIVQNKDKSYVDKMIHSEPISSVFPKNSVFKWSLIERIPGQGDVWFLYPLEIPSDGVPIVSNKDIESAEMVIEDRRESVNLRMNPTGAEKWATMTENNINKCIAISVNDVVFAAPTVINPIRDGFTQISGSNLTNLTEIAQHLNVQIPDNQPKVQSHSMVAGRPPFFNALIQQVLIVLSSILLLFFTIRMVMSFRVN